MADTPSPSLEDRLSRLESELTAARREIARLQGRPAPSPTVTAEMLQRQSQAWDKVLGTGDHRGAPRAGTGRRTFEDIGASFVIRNTPWIWAALLLLSAAVVAVKEGLI